MSIKIMIVEDERIVALHLRQQLTKLGYTVTAVAASGRRALQSIKMVRPDIVLMDIHIDGDIDGIDTAAQIGDIPVVYLTAYSEEATLERARATNPYGYLLKPFSERELHATIQMAIKRREVEASLQDSEARLNFAMSAASMEAWEFDVESRSLLYGDKGNPRQKLQTVSLTDFQSQVVDEDWPIISSALERIIADGEPCLVEFRRTHPDNRVSWLRAQGKTFHTHPSAGARIIGVVQDVTERRESEEHIRHAAMVFEVTQDGIAILDPEFKIITLNSRFCDISGLSSEESIGLNFAQLPLCQNLPDDPVYNELFKNGQWRGEFSAFRKSGEALRTLLHIAAVKTESGGITHYVVVLSDMTLIRKTEADLVHLAHYDSLTHLPNRLLAMDRLEQALERGTREGHLVALLFIDLDHFKRINDTLGHLAGDELLRIAAHRMKSSVRAEDTVARLGGDEFMIILEGIDQPLDVACLAQKMLDAFAAPVIVANTELNVSASVGISLFPANGRSCEEMLRTADTAMYAAKEKGRNSYAFYTNQMTADAVHFMERERDLRHALKFEELVLYYQPQFCLHTGAVVGVEALLRWQHPQKGLLGPFEVIPFAEKNGLIVEIGEWVLRQACEQLGRWEAVGVSKLRMAVNVSVKQICENTLVKSVRRALDDFGVAPDRLELEITESTLQNEDQCLNTLRALEKLGVAIAIDDFGTGYSCLGSLRKFPIHRLKIDRTFVSALPKDRTDAAIAKTIIDMAHRLNMKVIAEGVENHAQEKFLREHACEEMQGFLYGKPMHPHALEEYMRNSPLRPVARQEGGEAAGIGGG